MKAKRFLAILTAATLFVLPTSSAFAGELTGVTSVDYVDPNGVLTFVAPTSASVDFTLDPQGLASIGGVGNWVPSTAGGNILPVAVGVMTNKSAAPVKAEISFTLTDGAEKIKLLDAADDIDADTENNMYLTITPADAKVVAANIAIAEETEPTYFQIGEPAADKEFSAADLVALGLDGSSANVKILASAATASFGDFVCTADAETIADAEALTNYDFEADADSIKFKQVEVPAHVAIDETVDVTVSEYNDESTGFADAASKVILEESGTGLAYKLDNAEYYAAKTDANEYELRRFDYNYATVKNDNYDTAAFVIGGQINKNADWSDYTTGGKTISLGAVYTFSFMTEEEYTSTPKLNTSYNSIAYSTPVPDVAPSVTTTSLSFSKAAPADKEITFSLGTGESAGTAVTQIYIDEEDTGKFDLLDPAYVDFITVEGTTITIDQSWLGGYASGATANLYVRFDMTDEEAAESDFTTPDCVITIGD